MDLEHLLVFAAAYFAVLILPGPAVTALTARVLARGPRGSAAYILGLVVGALVWFTAAAVGLTALAAAYAGLFVAIRYAGAAWLLYLAYKLWTAPVRPLQAADMPSERRGLFLAGLTLNLGNPKAMVFFLALLPSVVDLDTLTPLAFCRAGGSDRHHHRLRARRLRLPRRAHAPPVYIAAGAASCEPR